jgi:hypothetical protein
MVDGFIKEVMSQPGAKNNCSSGRNVTGFEIIRSSSAWTRKIISEIGKEFA